MQFAQLRVSSACDASFNTGLYEDSDSTIAAKAILDDKTICFQLNELQFNPEYLLIGDTKENMQMLAHFLKEKSNQDIDFLAGVYNTTWLKDFLWRITCPPYNI